MTNTIKPDNKNNIVITSELEAYEILQMALENKIPEYDRLIFDGWPTLNLHLEGEKFHQSLTPTVMKGLIEFQKSIYQSYAVAKYDSPNRRLTEEEKKDLEIRVDVKDGSSNFDINFQEIAVKLIEQIGSRMNPTELLLTVVAIAAMFFGSSSYKVYLDNRKELKSKEGNDEIAKAALSKLDFLDPRARVNETIISAIFSELQI